MRINDSNYASSDDWTRKMVAWKFVSHIALSVDAVYLLQMFTL